MSRVARIVEPQCVTFPGTLHDLPTPTTSTLYQPERRYPMRRIGRGKAASDGAQAESFVQKPDLSSKAQVRVRRGFLNWPDVGNAARMARFMKARLSWP